MGEPSFRLDAKVATLASNSAAASDRLRPTLLIGPSPNTGRAVVVVRWENLFEVTQPANTRRPQLVHAVSIAEYTTKHSSRSESENDEGAARFHSSVSLSLTRKKNIHPHMTCAPPKTKYQNPLLNLGPKGTARPSIVQPSLRSTRERKGVEATRSPAICLRFANTSTAILSRGRPTFTVPPHPEDLDDRRRRNCTRV